MLLCRIINNVDMIFPGEYKEGTFKNTKTIKEVDPLYQRFVLEYDANPESARCKDLALMVWNKYRFDVGDHNTPLVDSEAKLATKVGESLRKIEQLPDLIYR